MSAREEWNALVQKHIDQGKSRQEATKAANAENPVLREQLVAEANADRSCSSRRSP